MSETSDTLIRLMSALEDWEESRGAAQEQALLTAWAAFRDSFNTKLDARFLELLRGVTEIRVGAPPSDGH